MNKKILVLFSIFLVAILMASACAVDLTKENDFKGLFKMKVADNETFNPVDNGNSPSSLLQSKMAFKNNNGTIYVFYYENELNDAIFYASQDNITKFDSDGDLRIINATEQMKQACDGKVTVLVGKNPNMEKRTVFVGGTNDTLLNEYAETINF